MKKEDLTTRFLREIANIKEPLTFLGVVRALRIELINEDKEAKSFSELLEEVLYKFKNELSRERKRELLRILINANQVKGDLMPQIDAVAAHKEEEEVKVDANCAENSEASFSNSQM